MQKRNKEVLTIVLQVIGGAVFGAAIAYLGAHGAIAKTPGSRPGIGALALLFIGLLLGVFLAIALHELGHVVAGLSQGFKFWLLVAGPLEVSRDGNKLRFRRNRSPQLAGGIAACVPMDTHDLARRMTVMVAGGPLASLFTGALFYGISKMLEGPVSMLFLIPALMSFAVGAGTIIPMQTGSFNSDGARLLMYWRNKSAMDCWSRAAALTGLALTDCSPSSWPKDLIEEVRSAVDDSFDGVGAASMLYYQALDAGDERAAVYLDHFLNHQDSYPGPFRPSLRLEGAFFEGAIRRRASEARKWLEQSAGGVMIDPHTRLRAEAAVLLAEDRREEAARKAGDGLAELAKRPANGIRRTERKWLENIFAEASNR